MCMQMTGVSPYQKWRWAGDEIVHDAVIPAAHRIPNTLGRGHPPCAARGAGLGIAPIGRHNVSPLIV
jgi:hypothetical protein